ncbi:MAG: hypothetical protein WA417_18140 [Stellaceae bacterium]|jgi:hypothetical protein
MPAFFIPLAKDASEAETVYRGIRKFVCRQAAGPLDDRRIFRIEYRHNQKRFCAQVGEPEQREGGMVLAILKRRDYGLYLVCTPDRGAARGSPILVGENEITSLVDFDAAES